MSFSDMARPDRYLEIWSEVVAVELLDNLSWMNGFAVGPTGADFDCGADGEPRPKVTILVDA